MKRPLDWLLWIALPLSNTLNQVAMKWTAGIVRNDAFGLAWFADAARHPYIWISFVSEIISFALWLAILRRHNLSRAFPLTSVSYAALMAVSWGLFHEPILLRQIIGVAIIVAGIIVLGLSQPAERSSIAAGTDENI